ncbi:hypothetical protein FO441_09065 [Salinicoccus cyprini]|uniref:Uncharacterized protein n=1 Tax=Salinicoccus cyprini TaxID=2493691 RepID=A0A558AUB2_9STAP|nr:hypothetical protein FO441_09065 [Salinicoccus cyprini]
MEDRIMKILSLIIGIFFFAFYIVIIDGIFYNGSYLDFPYILLTIYFFISIFTLPLVSLEAGEATKDKSVFISSYSLIGAYLISPVWVASKFFKE